MQFSVFMLLAAGLVILCASMCNGDPIELQELPKPKRPKVFATPEQFQNYLDDVGNYYAIKGRPRWGKRNLAPWMDNYVFEDSSAFRNLPVRNVNYL